MTFAAGILVTTGMVDDGMAGAPTGSQMIFYVVGFILLFVLSGIGNGSTYKMIPSIFEAKAQGHSEWSTAEKAAWSRSMSGALIGFAGAVGALGGCSSTSSCARPTWVMPSRQPMRSGCSWPSTWYAQ